jgi:hypothetical protein
MENKRVAKRKKLLATRLFLLLSEERSPSVTFRNNH